MVKKKELNEMEQNTYDFRMYAMHGSVDRMQDIYATGKLDPFALELTSRRSALHKAAFWVSIQSDAVVAVIHVRIVFISSFLFYCLLLNHSFSTNPNRITNWFKLFSLCYNLQLNNYIAPASLFDF